MRLKLPQFEATVPVVRTIDHSSLHYEVFFLIYSDGKRTRFRYKSGINILPTASKRLKQAQATATLLKDALKMGWDPRKEKYPRFDLLEGVAKRDILSFVDALKFAVEEKRKILSKFSMYDYDGTVRFFTAAAKETGHDITDADKISRRDIRVILDAAVEQNSWTANARNKYLTILKALLTVAKKQEIIPSNPAHEIDDLPVPATEGYKRLTDKERDEVALHLLENHQNFYEYILFIYQVGIRRTELLQVQIGDINLQERSLRVRSDVAKTNHFRYIPLTDELLAVCMRREIWNKQKDFYLFGEHFLPSSRPIHPNTPSNWWRKIVIDGMGIDCKMYSLKHKGADDKILAGIPIETLKTIYGHKSIQMTEIYAKAVKKKYAEEIIEKAPALGKVVAMKKAK